MAGFMVVKGLFGLFLDNLLPFYGFFVAGFLG